jgi:hypothetical protein
MIIIIVTLTMMIVVKYTVYFPILRLQWRVGSMVNRPDSHPIGIFLPSSGSWEIAATF